MKYIKKEFFDKLPSITFRHISMNFIRASISINWPLSLIKLSTIFELLRMKLFTKSEN